MKQLNQTLRLVWDAGPVLMVAGLFFNLLQGLLPLAGLYVMKLLVDTVVEAAASPVRVSVGPLFIVLGAGLAVALGVALLQSIAGILSAYQSEKVVDHVAGLLHRKSVAVDLLFYENPAFYDSLHQALKQGSYRPIRMVTSLSGLTQNAFSLLAIAGLLFAFHWGIVLILSVATVPGILINLRHARRHHQWQRDHTGHERKCDYFNWILTSAYHAKELRLFGLGDYFLARFSDMRERLRKGRLRLSQSREAANLAAQCVKIAATFGVLGWVTWRAFSGLMSIGEMVMVVQAVYKGTGYLGGMLNSLIVIYEDRLFVSHFFEFMEMPQRIVAPERPCALPKEIAQGIQFENVDFSYPNHDLPVLKNLTFSVRPGETVAVVGKNGSGKTTLVKLLCRLYDPTRGCIAIDGIPLTRFYAADWRRQVSAVFQDSVQYQLTAAQNIAPGNNADFRDTDRIKRAARDAGIHQVIEGLPGGYDTILGYLFAGGRELSIGQWQKLALARALVRDAWIVVLDEPASSMDPDSEYRFFRRFKKMVGDRIGFIISHRFSTVQMADRILVLNNGTITESGTHQELLMKGGEYARMFMKQAQLYPSLPN